MSNRLKFMLRTLWRNRLFTLLNVLGLSVGLGAAWIAFQIVRYEFSYDAPHPNRDRIFRVVSRFSIDGKESGNAGMPAPLAKAAAGLAGVELAVPVFDRSPASITVPGIGGGQARVWEDDIRHIVETDDRYFRLTAYQWLAGSPVNALAAPGQLVLTRSRAERYFPGLSPEQVLGQSLFYNDTTRMTVTGVVADLDYPSVFVAKEMYAFAKPITDEKKRWAGVNSNQQLFLLLDPQTDPDRVTAQINRLSDENSREELAKYKMTRQHALQPLAAVHFDTEFASHIRAANKKVLFGILAVAGFLLLLAIVNYINLATAQLPQRAREIGVRKTLGGQKSGMIVQFLGETALVSTASVLVAGVLALWFLKHGQDLIPSDKGLLDHVRMAPTLAFAALLVVGVSLLSGVYPGWVMAKIQAVSLLRGQVTGSNRGGVKLRQGLIVFQFVVSQLLLIIALGVGRQMHFLMRQDLGFDREAVVLVDVPWKVLQKPGMGNRHYTLAEELKKIPEIAGISLGEPLFSTSFSGNTHLAVNEKGVMAEHDLYRKNVDTAAIRLYGLPLLAGRNLLPSDTLREYVINETAVRAFGFASPQAAVGQVLHENQGADYPIVGVVRDFHMLTSYEKIEPVAMTCNRDGQSTLNIKLAGSDPDLWQRALGKIEGEWQKLYPTVPFKYQFYDDVLAEAYAEDRKLSSLANGTMLIALLISCLGLFGLSTFTTLRRTKEIGIRKVLGATVAGITGLLARDTLKLVLLAIVIASPVAGWLLQRWLRDFAYRIELQWWMFVLGGLAAVSIAFLTVSFQSIKAALADPVRSLRNE